VVATSLNISCDPVDTRYVGGAGTSDACHQRATSNILFGSDLAAVLPLGDNQYENATQWAFLQSYDASWGRLFALTHPVPGNHEYQTLGAAGYYGYFGPLAGDPTKGYYSYDLGDWHIIVLNSNLSCAVISCAAGSAQDTWLRADLAANTKACTLAYWHHPRFNSGSSHGNNTDVAPFWDALYQYNADVILNGHEHVYERFAPQTPNAVADPVRGIRQFTVGTGGRSHYSFGTIQPNSEVRNATTYGVLKLTLRTNGYDWQFVPIAGSTFTDSGSGTCH
jgi:acid phosphatase type 7